ncbi:MAG: type I DNA topoisomerase [Alphaproteobacteria bacterium]|nr:type I DNA topoisomerase [Alphaproteobacteria bacterium]
MDLVIVESPTKAKTINKYLGKKYKVLASFGHVRDLSSRNGSVQPENDFALNWETAAKSQKHLNTIIKAAEECESIILATDPDREGEAISWHIYEILRSKKALKNKPFKRVVFNAITEKSVLEAMQHPRDIDSNLVEAYLARRSLDYLVGYSLSPVLWRKLPGARSAGRVQSVALRIICDRENEIERFVSQDYWSINAMLEDSVNKSPFLSRLVEYKGHKLDKLDINSEQQASEIKAELLQSQLRISNVEAKQIQRSPSAPFTTSTLQQAASTQLGFFSAKTMQLAQKLYEGIDIGGETSGLITYMRTDSTQIVQEAILDARNVISKNYGTNYLPAAPRTYSTKAKNAQEAHEAIRPTYFARKPEDLTNYLDGDQLKLYGLIWKRAIASQMASAKIERTTINISATATNSNALLRATGSVISFKGFLSVYNEVENDASEPILPALTQGQELEAKEIIVTAHKTEPPPRYSEASLIKKLEDLGIGRPSTYASILSTLSDRGYVINQKRKLLPQAKGRFVTEFLKQFFAKYVEYDFTANLENELDEISNGELQWKKVLANFWQNFHEAIDETNPLRISDVIDNLNDELAPFLFPPNEEGEDPRLCPNCKEGRLSLKLSRFGAFIGCTNYPECKYIRQIGEEDIAMEQTLTERTIGHDENTGEEIKLLNGRFGPYVQRGEGSSAKNASIPKDCDINNITVEIASALLNLPREIGINPESGKMITAAIGRYGPYLLHDGSYTKLSSADQVFDLPLEEAVELIKNSPKAGTKAAKKLLGEHPTHGPISLQSGRFGPYVKAGSINATIPKSYNSETLTLEQAIELINKKAKK